MNAVVGTLSKTPARIDLLLRKALLDKLARLENAVLTIADPLGEFDLGSDGPDSLRARIDVLDMRFYRQIAVGGSIGAAESYMDQDWQADDLCRVIQILVRDRDLLDSMEGGLATLANQLLKVWHFANRNSQQGSKKNIAAHYDLGNALLALFLDQHGMYSSATFYQPELNSGTGVDRQAGTHLPEAAFTVGPPCPGNRHRLGWFCDLCRQKLWLPYYHDNHFQRTIPSG